jgi:tight adherence protein B
MFLAFLVFVAVTILIMGGYFAAAHIPGAMASRRLAQRLRDVGTVGPPVDGESPSVVRSDEQGPLPVVDRLIEKAGAASALGGLIEQSGVRMSPGAFVLISVLAGLAGFVVIVTFVRVPFVAALAAVGAGAIPYLFLLQRRSARIKRFEEQFPEALDLLSRALRAGHAFQTAMGMVAEELPAPVGPEFKKTFDQQNFGLPLKDCLLELADRIPLLDVRFFVTAVSIQRETGGNLAEILDNLANVVRERFKILRQVRVHTAHGRFTGWVLLALPAALGIALSLISPDHMNTLFTEQMGKTMLIGAAVMQAIGYVWIRKVVKIEV